MTMDTISIAGATLLRYRDRCSCGEEFAVDVTVTDETLCWYVDVAAPEETIASGIQAVASAHAKGEFARAFERHVNSGHAPRAGLVP